MDYKSCSSTWIALCICKIPTRVLLGSIIMDFKIETWLQHGYKGSSVAAKWIFKRSNCDKKELDLFIGSNCMVIAKWCCVFVLCPILNNPKGVVIGFQHHRSSVASIPIAVPATTQQHKLPTASLQHLTGSVAAPRTTVTFHPEPKTLGCNTLTAFLLDSLARSRGPHAFRNPRVAYIDTWMLEDKNDEYECFAYATIAQSTLAKMSRRLLW